MLRRFLPYPLLFLCLVLMWLVLTRFSLGQLLLGSAIAMIATHMMARLQPARPRIRRVGSAVKLFVFVFLDIIRSNISVVWLILTNGRHGRRRSAFVPLQLELRDPTGLAILAMIITATPGSAWIEYSADTDLLVVHVFDLIDEEIWHAQIKGRYETLLREIFE